MCNNENKISFLTFKRNFRDLKENNIKHIFQRLKRILNLKSKTSITKYSCFLKYGKEEGTKRWNSYCEKQRYTCSKEYFGMSDEEFELFNKSRAVTEINLIKKYGKEEGTKRWNSYCEKQRYTCSKEYFVEKYGSENGTKKFENFSKTRPQTLESYIYRLGFEEGKNQFYSFIQNKVSQFYSKISSELFFELDKHIKYKTYFQPKSREFGKMDIETGKYYFYDFVIEEIKLCIEFNGDIFHANPKFFTENETPNPFEKDLKSVDIWKKDEKKKSILEKYGFKIVYVWESDYLENKDKIIKECLKIIGDRENEIINRRF